MKSNLSLRNISPSEVTAEQFQELLAFVLSLPLVENKGYDVSVSEVANNVARWLFQSEANSAAYTEDGMLVGVCLNSVQNQWWEEAPSLINTVTYVLPKYRSLGVFKDMLQNAEEYAKIKGMKFYFSPVACNKLDVKKRLMKSLG